MIKLTVDDVIFLHKKIIDKTGGIRGIRDIGLLEMAVNSPFASFGGEELYKSLDDKARQLCNSLIRNHPFLDGNKRIGILVMLIFLHLNGEKLDITNEEIVALGIYIAKGNEK
mgnify:CR=1 FL=1|jgi:death-on-curing protein